MRNKTKFNPKGMNSVLKKLEALKQTQVVVGIPAVANKIHEGGVSNAVIAAAHEFGVPDKNIPERSFLRSTFNENKDKAASFLATRIRNALISKGDMNKPFELLGLKMATEVKGKIQSGIEPPLLKATIKRKGSSKPLIDTGQLVQSITYEVRNG